MKKTVFSHRITWARSRNKRGQTLVEYALILAFVSVVAIAVFINMSTQVSGVYGTINTQLGTAQVGGSTTSARNH